MNKCSAISAFVALLACAGVGFCVNELRKVSGSLSEMEERLVKLQNAPPPAASSAGSASSGSSASMAEVTQEIKNLKAEMAAVKTEQETIVAASKGTPPTPRTDGSTATTPINADLRAAVEAVLAAKEQEKKDADAKRTSEWMGRATQGMVDNLVKELGLTEQQKAQVTDIVNKQSVAFREALTSRKEGEDPREKMVALKSETDTQIKAVLTPEQGVKYDEIAKTPMGMFGGGFGGGGRRSGRGGSEGN
ncbi:MAG: hypothetical protein AAB074_13710 [Planctomycetota bacterium]